MNRVSRNILLAVAFLPAVAMAQAPALTIFAGTVVDSSRQALTNAEVALPGLGFSKLTNDKGVFRLDGVTPGVHRVTVKHIGYGALDTVMIFREGQNIEWRVTLGRINTLDSVIVTAPLSPMMAEFESNRARGFGRFMTRADLAKVDGLSLDNVLRQLPGAAIMRSNMGMSFLTSKRAPTTGCIPPRPMGENREAALQAQEQTDECLRRERVYYVPDETEKRMGVGRACYPLVYVDRTLMNSGSPTPPFDIKSHATDQIEAIEWYEGSAQVPAKYSAHRVNCGVLVLHLRTKR